MNRLKVRLIACLLFIIGFAPPVANSMDPLTVAATGVSVNKVLDNLEEKAYGIIGRAAETGSLVADAGARNGLLAIAAAREELFNDLNEQWDTLESKKLQLLKGLDTIVDNLDKTMLGVEKLEEIAVLDIEGIFKSLPFTSTTYAIKSVKGASQYYRPSGEYRISIRSNALDFSGLGHRILLGGKEIKTDWIQQVRQYEVVLTIPAIALNPAFSDRGLSYVDISMEFEVPNCSWWEFWKDKTRLTSFHAKIQLYPRFPITYYLKEYINKPEIDTTRDEWWPSQITTVGGCGQSGCYATHNVFAYVPEGTLPTGRVKECTDTFNGWGSFVKPYSKKIWLPIKGEREIQLFTENYCTTTSAPVNAIAVNGTTVKMIYRQHCHNVSRNVQFKAEYHPLKTELQDHDRELHPFEELDPNTIPQAVLRAQPAGKIATENAGKLVEKTTETGLRIEEVTTLKPPEIPSGQHVGFLQYGQTYESRFTNEMVGFSLVAASFNGDIIVESESKKDPRIEVNLTDKTSFKRVLVTPKTPW